MSDIKYALYTSSKGFKVVGGTAAQFLKADGSVDNTSYIPTNTEINMGDKNLNFTTGAISKFDGSTRVFNKVFQKYNGTTPTGMASFKFPQATAGATMFDVTIKIHLWNLRSLATFRIAFYKNSATQIQPVYHKAIVECNDNFPATAVSAGIDAAGNVCINIGDSTTVWSTHVMFEVERVVSLYAGYSYDWSKGWFLTSETDTSSYQSLVNITPEIVATRNWVSSNIITSNSGQTDLSGNKATSGDWTFNGTSPSHLSLLRPGQTINNSIGLGFDTLFQYIGLADNNTFAIGNNVNLQSMSFRKFWLDFTKNSVNAAGQTGGSMLGSKDTGGFTITTSTDTNRAEMILRHVWTANNRTYGIGGVSASASGSMANWGMWQWFNDRTANGHDGFIGFIGNKDEVLISSLAGTGSRMVVANGNGVISTQTIPNLSNYYTQSEALNLFVGKNGAETINDTKTFNSSPIVPPATLPGHAINAGQLIYNDRNYITDTRGAQRPPSYYDQRYAQWDFQNTADTLAEGDAWHGVLTVAKWTEFNPAHRQEQIFFTGDNLKRRTATSNDTWGEVKTIWDSGNLNPVTIDTNQTITGSKIFAQSSDVTFYGNEYNDVQVWRNSSGAGFGGVVSGHIYNWYNSRWKAGNMRGGSSDSVGYGFFFSDDGGSNYTQKVSFGINGAIYSNGINSLAALGDNVSLGNSSLNYATIFANEQIYHVKNGVNGTVFTSHNFNPDGYQAWVLNQLNNYFNKFAIDYTGYASSNHDLNTLSQTGFYNIGFGTINDAGSYINNVGARALLHFQNEDYYSATQIQTHRYQGNLISRSKSDGGWSNWVRHWGDNDFTQTNINNWNNAYNNQGNYIPLTGTNNLTGMISSPDGRVQIGSDSFYKGKLWISDNNNSYFPGQYFELVADIENGFIVSANNNGSFSTLGVFTDGIYMTFSNNGSYNSYSINDSGIFGQYRVPMFDGSFVQRKYLTDNFIPKTHPVFNITQNNINSWNNNVVPNNYVTTDTMQVISGPKEFTGPILATGGISSVNGDSAEVFTGDGNVSALKDEIVNDKYAIRLDPHEYELDPSGYLDVDDRNRLIHIIGEQIKMAVNFKEIYPKQQIVIYNFDQKGYPMAVLIKDKIVYNIEPGSFLRLYVTKSLRVIAERQLPSEFIW
ncbi:hypothetical protein [uncultured Chryseobacterium sp.]|uniref:hypothetical protein n=1 Tax=uncultured Chryseobacterium sp. TaxID=259322 RepID=UPI0025FC17BF|nr:hypothetical protein [uncultured Chryseobacterium sp.]